MIRWPSSVPGPRLSSGSRARLFPWMRDLLTLVRHGFRFDGSRPPRYTGYERCICSSGTPAAFQALPAETSRHETNMREHKDPFYKRHSRVNPAYMHTSITSTQAPKLVSLIVHTRCMLECPLKTCHLVVRSPPAGGEGVMAEKPQVVMAWLVFLQAADGPRLACAPVI